MAKKHTLLALGAVLLGLLPMLGPSNSKDLLVIVSAAGLAILSVVWLVDQYRRDRRHKRDGLDLSEMIRREGEAAADWWQRRKNNQRGG